MSPALRGKRLAAPFASTTHYSLLKLLEMNGIGPRDVTLFDLNPSDMTAAWIRGDIDGAYIWQPTLQRLLDAGGTRLMSSDEMAARGVATFDVVVAGDDVMAAYPDVIVTYLKTLSQAVELYRNDRPKALEALARELGVSVDQARLQAEGLVWLSPDEQLDAKYFGSADAAWRPGDGVEGDGRLPRRAASDSPGPGAVGVSAAHRWTVPAARRGEVMPVMRGSEPQDR